MAHSDRRKIVIAYPLTPADFGQVTLQTLVGKCRHVHWIMDQFNTGSKPAGWVSILSTFNWKYLYLEQ